MITVTAAIIRKDNRIFAARRKAGKHLAGMWEFPGGKLESGESPEECLARELTEEFGIDAKVGRFLGESVHNYGDKTIKLMAFHVIRISGELFLNDHDELRWLAATELRDIEWAPADIPLLKLAHDLLDEKQL